MNLPQTITAVGLLLLILINAVTFTQCAIHKHRERKWAKYVAEHQSRNKP